MRKPFSLQPVRDLAQHRVDRAAVTLAQAKTQEAQARATLSMLERYCEDYGVRLEQALRKGIGPVELANYREFMSKLERATSQQRDVVAQCEARALAAMRQWQSERRKVKSFDVLAQRELAEERKNEQRHEQKELDEHCAGQHRRKHGNG